MPRFAANLTFLFKEYPFLERFEVAADAGFSGVEVLFPYDDPAAKILQSLTRANIPLVLINTPPPNWAGGDRGFAAIPGGSERFKKDFRRAMRYVERLNVGHLHIMAGAAEGAEAHQTFVDNLKWACEEAPNQSLTIEPLNPTDMPGYFLNSFGQAADIIDQIGAPNLGLQFDAYHCMHIAGNVLDEWKACAPITKHIQVGSFPSRNEPTMDLAAFFDAVDASNYKGFVSGEYNPKGRTIEGLGWIKGELEAQA